MIQALNHITITVRDLGTSISFYRDLLGMQLHVSWDKGAYLSAGELWFCLNLGQPKPAADYSHIAFSVQTEALAALRARLPDLTVQQWQQSSSEGDSLYLLDPDGHQLELHCGSLQTRLRALERSPYSGLIWHSKPAHE